MDPELPVPSPDNLDAKPSFHKLSGDAANRKYRRRSPVGASDSSSSDGSPKLERSHSPVFSKGDSSKVDGSGKKDKVRDLERNFNHNSLGRDDDSQRHSDRHKLATYHEYHRRDDCYRYRKDADEEERTYQRSSHSGQDSRGGNHSDHARPLISSDISRGNDQSVSKYSRDKSDINKYSRDKSDYWVRKSVEAVEYPKRDERHSSSSRVVSGGRHDVSHKNEFRRERGHYRDRGDRDEEREQYRSSGDYKNNNSTTLHEEVRTHAKDSRLDRDNGAVHRKETYSNNTKDIDKQEERKRKSHDRDYDKGKDKYACKQVEDVRHEARGSSTFYCRDGKSEKFQDKFTNKFEDTSPKKHKSGYLEKRNAEDVPPLSKTAVIPEDEEPLTSSKRVKEMGANVNSEPVGLSSSQADDAQDFSAAKVAAMKAAELVNRNLVGSGCLSTDQKKKLLWGSKKNTSAEEAGNRWDVSLFSDRERQEKFNKLMSLRLHWYTWPIVGCERGSEVGAQTRQQGCGEARETPDGLGEAVHCWAPQAGWQNCWSWTVIALFPLYALGILYTTLALSFFSPIQFHFHGRNLSLLDMSAYEVVPSQVSQKLLDRWIEKKEPWLSRELLFFLRGGGSSYTVLGKFKELGPFASVAFFSRYTGGVQQARYHSPGGARCLGNWDCKPK